MLRSALRHPAIARLWLGQAMSSIGDEIYRVGLTWLAVGLLGVDTGYLAAGQAAALMTLSLIGGRWADGWAPLRTMVRVDLLRAAIVACPVVVSFFHPVPLPLLVGVALTLSALSAFFDPALQSTLPHFAPDLTLLRAATGLMGTTIRLARLIGPTIVGLLSGVVPMIHFFTLDAVSFLISAISVHSLRDQAPPVPVRAKATGSLLQTFADGLKSIQREAGMGFVLWSRLVTSGTWTLTVSLGFALLVQQLAPQDVRAFGLLVATYGVGNVAGALWFGNHARPRPGLLLCAGYAGLGVGFVLLGSAPTLRWVMAAAVASGFAGPMNDLAFSDIMQERFPIAEIPRIFRLRMAVDTLSALVCTAMSPLLFRMLGVRGTIVLCGVSWIAAGAWGALQMEAIERRTLKAAVPVGETPPVV
jgi:MFS family permease